MEIATSGALLRIAQDALATDATAAA
jgi:hypothetical protein